jgi:hypothetical protein
MAAGILDPTHGQEQGERVGVDGEPDTQSDVNDILQQIMMSGILDPTHGKKQGVGVGDDVESDINDICQKIMTSGVLDLSPHRSFSEMNSADDSLIRHQRIGVKSTEIGDRGEPHQMSHSIQEKPRRRRGRPAKKVITRRECLN